MGLPTGIFNTRYQQDMAIVRTKEQWGILISFLIFLSVVPLFTSNYILGVVNVIGITIIAVHGLNILTGYCGQISLGHAAFMGVGAYTSGILATRFGLPFWLCLPAAGLTTAVVGALFGLPSLRIKGFYLALATLAAQFIIIYLIQTPLAPITRGVTSLSVPPAELGGLVFNTEQKAYYLIMTFTVFMTILAKNLVRTNTGRAFISIRDNDIAAETMGVNPFSYKILAFFIGCFYAGIAGSLWAHYVTAIHTDAFTLVRSIWLIGMLIIGGLGSTLGAILGVVFIQILNELVAAISPSVSSALPAIGSQAFAALGQLVFALVIISFLVFEPRGLAHRWEIFKASYRLWPFAY